MKKISLILTMLCLTALLFTGCTMRTVEEMYALPKRSEEFNELQTAIDSAMYGLTFSSPQSGENQQTVQMADLDGDGVEEYLVFARGATEKPLQILIFSQEEDGSVRTMDTIGIMGLTFEQVEYLEFDDIPGCELVVGVQVSDQVLRSVAVYSFHDGDAELLLLNGYSKFHACDLDENGLSELMVLRPGEAESQRGMAVLYSSDAGQIQRSVETELSLEPSFIRRIIPGRLQSGEPAIYLASTWDSSSVITDVLAMKDGRFSKVIFSNEADANIPTILNYYVYAEDIDKDGIMDIPSLITMKPVTMWQYDAQKYLLRWFSVDFDGREQDKIFTFHNFVGGWFIGLDCAWAGRISVEQGAGTYTFYVWDDSYQIPTKLFTIYVFTGSNRDENAVQNGRFALHRSEGVAYAAKLEASAMEYGITEEYLTEAFCLIRQDWQTEEN